jgi:ribosomal peptide maturation radical SAM protein 1
VNGGDPVSDPGAAERVLLISMPCGAVERPSLALGLLQAHCARENVSCEVQYLNLAFAEQVGLASYQWLCNTVPYTAFAGEWLFADALYDGSCDDGGYLRTVLTDTWQLSEPDLAKIAGIRQHVRPFLQACLDGIPWANYTLIGFTSVFQQNLASLALARMIKAAHPECTLAFGGANWEECMGAALLEQFDFVDLAFSGEADQTFPEVLRRRRNGLPVEEIAGVTTRSSVALGGSKAVTVRDLNDVPVPDFDAYFGQLLARPALAGVSPSLMVETSRGCWWGMKSHCTFCGLNGGTMAFRSKDPARVVAEFSELRHRYGVATFSVVDDILDSRYFHSVLPALAQADLGLELFWEVKANLSRDQVRALRDAGVMFIQPGVESLSDHVLTLMRKGTTGLRNIELLKWCKEYGVTPLWNLLYGFPDETAADYQETVRLLHAIWHLCPPTGYGPVRLDRFSPYHEDPASFGMVNVRPMEPFRFLYPFDTEILNRIAYYFEFDYVDRTRDDQFAREALDLAIGWMRDSDCGALDVTADPDGSLHVRDTRRGLTEPRTAHLQGWKAAVYEACDRSQLLPTLIALPEVRAADATEQDLLTFLGRCVEFQLMAQSGDRWLSLAVHTPAREAPPAIERSELRLVAAQPVYS